MAVAHDGTITIHCGCKYKWVRAGKWYIWSYCNEHAKCTMMIWHTAEAILEDAKGRA